jgi:bleomycin hydrolase
MRKGESTDAHRQQAGEQQQAQQPSRGQVYADAYADVALPRDANAEFRKALSENTSFRVLQDALTHVPMNELRPFGRVTQKKYAIELTDLPAQDQERSGRCWIFAGVNVLRRLLLEKYKGLSPTDVQLSHAFIYFYAWMEKGNAALEWARHFASKGMNASPELPSTLNKLLADGGTWSTFSALVKKYGVVPLDAFPDSEQASSSRDLNRVAGIILRTAIAQVFQLFAGSPQKASSPSSHRHEFARIKQQTLARLYRALSAMLGTPPASFELSREVTKALSKSHSGNKSKNDNKNKSKTRLAAGPMTPLSFYNEVVRPAFDPDDYVCITSDPRQPSDTLFAISYGDLTGHSYNSGELNEMSTTLGACLWNVDGMGEVKGAALRALRRRTPVWFSCDVFKFYSNNKMYMNASATSADLLTGTDIWSLPRGALMDSGAIENSHAMTLVGYDPDGDVWKVDNSWGQTHALIMSGRWFERFVVTAVVPKQCLDPATRGKYERAARELRPRMLPPWDLYGNPQF